MRYKETVALAQGLFYKALGAKVRHARQLAGVSQAKLADCVGLSRSSVANIETGRQPIYVDALLRIAKLLNTPVSSLIPHSDCDLDAAESEKLKNLPDDQRVFVIRVMRKSNPQKKESNGSKVFSGKKASGRVIASRTHPKRTDTH